MTDMPEYPPREISFGQTDLKYIRSDLCVLRADVLKLVDALEFYKSMGNYLAGLSEHKIGFDFKRTPVHNDGGDIARQALTEFNAKHGVV